MKNAIVVLSVFMGVCTVAHSANTRIVNGTVVTNRAQFSYQVSFRVRSTGSHFCGGAIIAQGAILTAAHCFQTHSASTVVAIVGDLNLYTATEDTITMDLAAVITHSQYNSTTYENDVAVALSSRNFTWSSTVSFLPLANVAPTADTECYVSGWGATYYSGPASPRLLYAMVPIVNNTVCSIGYGSSLTQGMLCAGYMDGSADACSGDSGGPLACGGVVAGIVSWGNGCAYPLFPGIYTDVANYRSWIETQIGDYVPNNSHSAMSYFRIHLSLFLILCVNMFVK